MMHKRKTFPITISVISIFLGDGLITPSWAMEIEDTREEGVSLLINNKIQEQYNSLADSDNKKSASGRYHKQENRECDNWGNGENRLFAIAGIATTALVIITGGMLFWLH